MGDESASSAGAGHWGWSVLADPLFVAGLLADHAVILASTMVGFSLRYYPMISSSYEIDDEISERNRTSCEEMHTLLGISKFPSFLAMSFCYSLDC